MSIFYRAISQSANAGCLILGSSARLRQPSPHFPLIDIDESINAPVARQRGTKIAEGIVKDLRTLHVEKDSCLVGHGDYGPIQGADAETGCSIRSPVHVTASLRAHAQRIQSPTI